MSALRPTPIQQHFPAADPPLPPGTRALLAEIAQLLRRLVEQGEPGAIDLGGLPLGPVDHLALREALGEGEVDIRLDAAGGSRIRETGVPGVWWVQHRDAEGALLVELIEVARVPAIVSAQPADMEQALARLRAAAAGAPEPEKEDAP